MGESLKWVEKHCGGKRRSCSLRAISPFSTVFSRDLSPLQKHLGTVVCGFGRKSCVSTGVRKPGNTCVTDHDMTLAVNVALNSNTTNHPMKRLALQTGKNQGMFRKRLTKTLCCILLDLYSSSILQNVLSLVLQIFSSFRSV